jgi:hypothetical protein
MILREGNLSFDFSDAVDGFKFDEQDKDKENFHGLSHCMKAVDFIVEFHDYYLFVEIKNPTDSSEYNHPNKKNDLIKTLVTKFRDSFIYRWAEEKLDKPVKYLCLVELDNAAISYLMKELKIKLPATVSNAKWKKPLIETCIVTNRAKWNSSFPDWRVSAS